MRQVTEHLRRRIVAGDLSADRQLPSVRKLARLYGVSIPTMQGALHALETVGFVRITHGVGVFVARPRSAAMLLVHAWQEATPYELAAMRATIDERMPVLAARIVRQAPGKQLPRLIQDLTFFAGERSHSRRGLPAEAFVRADLAFHHAIVASVRGAEMSTTLYDQIVGRLMPALTAAAGQQAADLGLDGAHLALATAITSGAVPAAARLASTIARREVACVEPTLG
jgi:GntR family transcriptional regulator, transcriptional repressor for pyruvate dehydrogenase complex